MTVQELGALKSMRVGARVSDRDAFLLGAVSNRLVLVLELLARTIDLQAPRHNGFQARKTIQLNHGT